jgi:hypothetical protein
VVSLNGDASGSAFAVLSGNITNLQTVIGSQSPGGATVCLSLVDKVNHGRPIKGAVITAQSGTNYQVSPCLQAKK